MATPNRLIAVLLLLAAACSGPASFPGAGSRAPDFRADDLTGRTVYLSAELGRPVLLTFFATWCKPCLEEIPRLVALAGSLGDRVTFLCVVVDPENEGKVRSIASSLKIPYPMLMDEGGRIKSAYAVRGLPATFLIGRDGRIRSRLGYLGDDEIRALTEAIDRLRGGLIEAPSFSIETR